MVHARSSSMMIFLSLVLSSLLSESFAMFTSGCPVGHTEQLGAATAEDRRVFETVQAETKEWNRALKQWVAPHPKADEHDVPRQVVQELVYDVSVPELGRHNVATQHHGFRHDQEQPIVARFYKVPKVVVSEERSFLGAEEDLAPSVGTVEQLNSCGLQVDDIIKEKVLEFSQWLRPRVYNEEELKHNPKHKDEEIKKEAEQMAHDHWVVLRAFRPMTVKEWGRLPDSRNDAVNIILQGNHNLGNLQWGFQELAERRGTVETNKVLDPRPVAAILFCRCSIHGLERLYPKTQKTSPEVLMFYVRVMIKHLTIASKESEWKGSVFSVLDYKPEGERGQRMIEREEEVRVKHVQAGREPVPRWGAVAVSQAVENYARRDVPGRLNDRLWTWRYGPGCIWFSSVTGLGSDGRGLPYDWRKTYLKHGWELVMAMTLDQKDMFERSQKAQLKQFGSLVQASTGYDLLSDKKVGTMELQLAVARAAVGKDFSQPDWKARKWVKVEAP